MSADAPAGRPRVVCHLMTSIDGRIVVDGWPDPTEARREYERVHASYAADGWICGRVTMEPFAGGVGPSFEHDAAVDRRGHVADHPRPRHRSTCAMRSAL